MRERNIVVFSLGSLLGQVSGEGWVPKTNVFGGVVKVSSAVPSASWVLTVVFGMGTGVSPKRIDARNIVIQF